MLLLISSLSIETELPENLLIPCNIYTYIYIYIYIYCIYILYIRIIHTYCVYIYPCITRYCVHYYYAHSLSLASCFPCFFNILQTNLQLDSVLVLLT